MDKKIIRKKLGLSSETFNFYVKSGEIWVIKGKKDEWDYNRELENQILEKSTVYKYCYSDNWREHIKLFEQTVKHTGKVKVYTREEIEEYQRKKDKKNGTQKKKSWKWIY